MTRRLAWGEFVLCLVFGAAGAFWVAIAMRMPLWDGFAPASGFLPLIYGLLLIGLAAAATIADIFVPGEEAEPPGAVARPLVVLLALAAAVAGIEVAGFVASMTLAMLFLFRFVERLRWLPSLVSSAGSALALALIFRGWLGVPLPRGLLGF